MKVMMAIYNLKGKVSIWWQDMNISQGLKQKNLEWSEFKKFFKKQCLWESYDERKKKEFYELKLVQMGTKDLSNKFLYILRFVPYIKEGKVKVQWLLNCLSHSCKDRTEVDNPKTLHELLTKERLFF